MTFLINYPRWFDHEVTKGGIQEEIRAKHTGHSMATIFYLETWFKRFSVEHYSHTVTKLHMLCLLEDLVKLPAKTDLSPPRFLPF